MKQKGVPQASAILPVSRSQEEAKRFYNRLSRFYDYFSAPFERKYARMALEQLSLQEGENVLEIGFGTGYCLERIAKAVGKTGKVYGIDISSGMLKLTRRRLEKASLMDRVELYCGDATSLPFSDEVFDGAFMSFTLELFDTPEIPKLLEEIKRVLKPAGRLGAVSISREDGGSIIFRLYEWAHMRWPKYVDCRPIYLELSLMDAGYEIQTKQKVRLMGLPFEVVVARNKQGASP